MSSWFTLKTRNQQAKSTLINFARFVTICLGLLVSSAVIKTRWHHKGRLMTSYEFIYYVVTIRFGSCPFTALFFRHLNLSLWTWLAEKFYKRKEQWYESIMTIVTITCLHYISYHPLLFSIPSREVFKYHALVFISNLASLIRYLFDVCVILGAGVYKANYIPDILISWGCYLQIYPEARRLITKIVCLLRHYL